MSKDKFKVIQLIPANGWFALYYQTSEPYLEFRRLLSFALIEEEGGKPSVDGIDQGLTLCLRSMAYDEKTKRWRYPQFKGFYYEQDITEALKAQLAKEAEDAAKPS